MGKSLVIVESPAKAKTISKFLGGGYDVKASMGHVRDLPKGSMGVNIEEDFQPKYMTIRGRGKTVSELRKASKEADKIFLAPDPDREGEAIAWHLTQVLKLDPEKVFRVTFNEITGAAVDQAFQCPGKIDMDRVYAQQARRILDRIVGYKLSPLLWKKIARGLSAGRVQSVAVRLIVEREREITAFEPEEFWKIQALLRVPGEEEPFKANLWKVDGDSVRIPDKAAADDILARLKDHPFVVSFVKRIERTEQPPAPFSTSTLQQQASIHLSFSARKTMRIAQQLYEGVDIGKEGIVGLITYMRTDSHRISEEAMKECRSHISDNFAPEYLPERPNVHPSRKGAQAAHEAVRPTRVGDRDPDRLKPHLTKDQHKLYKLIWERFVASQMTPARYESTQVRVRAGDATFLARGKKLIFDGHLRVSDTSRDRRDEYLPHLAEEQALEKESVEATRHFTQPPPRYSEATLVKTLEKKGIGRPSTYASIISTIQDRGYVKLKERKFHATELGDVVTTQLVAGFPDLIDTEFTAAMEAKLDLIEEGEEQWLEVLKGFYGIFSGLLEAAEDSMVDLKKNPKPAGVDCDLCGSPMVHLFTKYGPFIGCSGFPECRNTLSTVGGDGKGAALPTEEVCEKCGSPMVIRTGRRGRFLACSAYPKCRNTLSVDENLKPLKPESTGIDCEKCGAAMIKKFGRRGPFLACSAYPGCRNTKPLPEALKTEKRIDREKIPV